MQLLSCPFFPLHSTYEKKGGRETEKRKKDTKGQKAHREWNIKDKEEDILFNQGVWSKEVEWQSYNHIKMESSVWNGILWYDITIMSCIYLIVLVELALSEISAILLQEEIETQADLIV